MPIYTFHDPIKNEQLRWETPEGFISLKAAVDEIVRAKSNRAGRTRVTEGSSAEVRPRYVAAIIQLRELLSLGDLTAFEFAPDELPKPIEPSFWKSIKSDHVLKTGLHQKARPKFSHKKAVDLRSLIRPEASLSLSEASSKGLNVKLVIVSEVALLETLSALKVRRTERNSVQGPDLASELDDAAVGRRPLNIRAIEWMEKQLKLTENGMSLRDAAKIIASEEDKVIDVLTVERETRRVRRERREEGAKAGKPDKSPRK